MMNQEEVTLLIPDLVDGTLSDDERAQAEAALQQYPELQRELEIARQVRTVLATVQANYPELRVSAGFEARLLARVRERSAGLEILDLSCTAFTEWLVEFINLLGGLFVPVASSSRSTLPLGS
jgi:beta-phosphoglucomutase-like phosphatase (HAD superfamily)